MLLILLANGCQTWHRTEESLPPSMAAFFGSCLAEPSKGYGRVEFQRGTDWSQRVELDWLREGNRLQVWGADRFGSEAFQLLVRGKTLLATSPHLELSSFGVDEGGLLVWDERPVGLHVTEVACFLNERFPIGWLEEGQLRRNKDSWRLRHRQDEGVIVVNFSEKKDEFGKYSEACAHRTVGSWLWSVQVWNWCMVSRPSRQTQLNVRGGLRAKFTWSLDGNQS